ncbi:TonB-dependent receptor [Methylosinus sp. R-45379]|uniref:TonB-dependent receptor n=1 Tax=Methylosinus sp. R-45379 TaxID=980563 RepID=UPI000A6F54C5|nr:TonB-dependent receptor [Methylosinus sp. R-45379]
MLGSRISLVALMVAAAPALQARAQEALPDIDVIAAAPEAGAGIERSKVPTNPIMTKRSDLDRDRALVITDTLQRRNASVSIVDVAGNPFQPDLTYRGFSASPVSGTPQGLAVYQDGVRINEAFGDVVNFDLIPTVAIANSELVSGNPLFGLNALGGALTLEMKNGFTWQGYELEGRGGSFGRRYGAAQVGQKYGDFAIYSAFEALGDSGWRKRSGSELLRGYLDLGYKGDKAEFHLNYTGATTRLGAAAATPVEMLQRDYSSVYTTPQSSTNELHFLNLKGSYDVSSALKLNGNFYYRDYQQAHIDGNIADMETCSSKTFVCQDNDPFIGNVPTNAQRRLIGPNGAYIRSSVLAGGLPATIDYSRTHSRSYGGAIQGTYDEKIADFKNKLIVGGSFDRQFTDFRGYSELGILQGDFNVTSTGLQYFNSVPEGGFQPSSVFARNLYYGVYALDTLDLTDKLTLTAGLRFNSAEITLYDRLSVRLNSDKSYQRVNPVAGLTYTFIPEFTVYGNYSEANRAPTALENGCADANHPCTIDSFLVADPPLKQVVTRSGEIGFRGYHDIGPDHGRLEWKVDIFRAVNSDDIVSLPSNVIQGRGYFANVGATRRQGVEAGVAWRNDQLSLYADYALIDATFRSAFDVQSESNPYADANGLIHVRPGNVMPGVPRHRVKLGFDYFITPEWKFGADYIFTSGVRLRGDESNLDKPLPSWGVVNLKTSYKVTENVEVYALAQNLFDRRYYTFGTYFDNSGNATASAGGFTNARTYVPGAPVSVYGGVKVKF